MEEEDEVLGDPMALVNSSPWPTELPGLVKIDRYYELKDEALDRRVLPAFSMCDFGSLCDLKFLQIGESWCRNFRVEAY